MGGWDEERLRAAGSISSKYQSMEQQQQQASNITSSVLLFKKKTYIGSEPYPGATVAVAVKLSRVYVAVKLSRVPMVSPSTF